MNFKLLHKIFAGTVFAIALVSFYTTVQPSVSFWDCGEFIAAGYYLQVPHPPGTPFFLLLGRIFSMLPFVENIAFRFNLISVLSSAFTVMFLYLVVVKLINNYRQKAPENLLDALGTYVAAAIGALAFSFSDTFWFNGTEAEVYALSMFLVAIITWLMLRWHERADDKDNEKYILMIAYLVGISTGVHLMSVLAIVPVAMIIFFRKYVDDEEQLKNTGMIFLVHAGVILLIAIVMWAQATGTSAPSPEQYQEFDSKLKVIFIGISVLIMGIFWKKVFNKNSFYMPLIIGGIALFLTYPGVVKFLPEVLTSIAGNNVVIGIFSLLVLLALVGYGVKWSIENNKSTWHLVFMSFLFMIIGFTTFAMVIIRANQNPPMNENEPDQLTELVSYLNREQYGDFPTFKRRFSAEAHQQGIYTNYSSDLDFFWRYQMNHMMTRYLLWNFAGREGWVQDDGANVAPFNAIGNFFGKIISVHFDGSVKHSLFGIPFLIGLLGIYFHFKKDWKMAAVFMVMFILMGYLTAFYQNQQQPQPRERDYFYVGAFFVYSIWIAIGIRGLVDLIQKSVKRISVRNASVVGLLVIGFVLIPVNMLKANYFVHDRSNNWVPWDYSYNLLQSCAPNAILFTNGDNDTFPLWYLQDVEKVRRDVKIVNLSLLNTHWYIKQLRDNDPYNVGTVKMRLNDQQIDQLAPMQWKTQQYRLPLPDETTKQGSFNDMLKTYDIADSSVLKSGQINFTMQPTLNFGNVQAIRVQDIMVRDIVFGNAWQRPIYFAVTCSEDSKIGLSDYLKMEGMAMRLVPEKRSPGIEFVNQEILRTQLYDEPTGFSRDYQPGFKFRGLNNPDIFFDDNHQRMAQNYRNAFIRLAISYVNTGQNDKAAETLDLMEQKIPRENIHIDLALLYEVSNIYFNANAVKQGTELANEVEQKAWKQIEENPTDIGSYYSPYAILLRTYENLNDYDKLVELWRRIGQIYPNDPRVQENIKKYEQLAKTKTDTTVDTTK